MKINILGIQIDTITLPQATEQILTWVKSGGSYYIVTPNVEFIMAAKKDVEFRQILNKADLSIPDSARFSWAYLMLSQKSFLTRLFYYPFFLLPKLASSQIPVTTGADLTTALLPLCEDRGVTVGFLGGKSGLAERLVERLKKDYPKLKIGMALSDIEVDKNGEVITGHERLAAQELKIDILFVGLGQIKQEKWIVKNRKQFPAKIMIGVGGTLDYLSGRVTRAPLVFRSLGLEWLFRLILQPWRLKRFGPLVAFTWLVLWKKN